jgi:CBS domain-containing protein
MTEKPETIRPTDVLALAQEKMAKGGFRRLPVVDDSGHLIGIITDRDLREHKGFLPTTRVTAAIVENPVTVSPDDTIEAAAHLMLERKIGGLPVVASDGQLVGIITETDLLSGFVQRRYPRK